jgi:hypothetical protein
VDKYVPIRVGASVLERIEIEQSGNALFQIYEMLENRAIGRLPNRAIGLCFNSLLQIPNRADKRVNSQFRTKKEAFAHVPVCVPPSRGKIFAVYLKSNETNAKLTKSVDIYLLQPLGPEGLTDSALNVQEEVRMKC